MSRVRRGLLIYLPLLLCSAVILLPLVYMLCASIKTNEEFFTSPFLPRGSGFLGIAWDHLTSVHYRRLFYDYAFGNNIINSCFLASATSILATLLTAMGGYALARFTFRGRSLLMGLVLGTLVLPNVLLLAPSYQLLYRLGLLDHYGGVILPLAAPAFGVYLFRQAFIAGLPRELLEAGRIDGCGEMRLFFSVALPMVRPMVGAFLLITYVGTWNNFIWPQIVLQTPEKMPLSVAIAQLRGVYFQDYGMMMAGTAVSVAPVLVLFLLLQREFIAGLTAGAVKS
ncbi:MAG TPA: carbohydrate ABC transporter permease [Phycisphaerae bacterium]|nr:carbohydrate ABC transporter permease [Phycisphaerales bacterium]HRX84672.1 carbohydrate ABC transporter permease [Phycisphaerae bacterium]